MPGLITNRSERAMLDKACKLARQKHKAFGLEYFSSGKRWRATISDGPDIAGCWWRHCSSRKTRRGAIGVLLQELAEE